MKNKLSFAFILLLSLGAGLLAAIASGKYGPGMTHDSAAYVYAAQSLLDGEGFQYFGYPSPFIQWPPLYPSLLALGRLMGIGFRTSAVLINSLALVLTVFISGYWMFKKFRFKAFAVAGTFLLFVSVPLLNVSKYLWTEITFILFIMLFYMAFERYMLYGNYSSLLLAALFTSLACIDRYAGVTVILTSCVFILFTRKGIVKKIKDVFVYGVVSIIPLFLWTLRNYIVSGTFFGVRLASTYTFMQNIERTLNSLYAWIAPNRLLIRYLDGRLMACFTAIAVILLLVAAAAFISLFVRILADCPARRELKSYCSRESGRLFPVAFFSAFTLIYTIYLVASASIVLFEPINSRYLAPVYIPVLIVIAAAADFLSAHLAHRRSDIFARKAGVLAALFIIIYLVYPTLNTAAFVLDNYRNGAGGFATSEWQNNNELVRFIKDNGRCTFYSNNADAVYTLTGIRTFYPPKKNGHFMYGLDQFMAQVMKDNYSLFIWFENNVSPALYSINDIEGVIGLKKVGDFNKGGVFRFIKKTEIS